MSEYMMPPPPPQGYWTEHTGSTVARAKARAKGEIRAVDEFLDKVEKAYDLTAQEEKDPVKLGTALGAKPVELWAEQYIYFPQDFVDDWEKWERVDPRAERNRQITLALIEQKLAEAGVEITDVGGAGSPLDVQQ